MSLPSGLCLVTGATGFVGSAVARALLKAGHPVRVLARPTSDRRNLQGLSVEVAEGSLEDGEGLVGMSWAALAAGARAVVASQWRVEASSTTRLMLAFHSSILHGQGKSQALRRAELVLIHSDRYAHPFYWAGFVLMGDGD